MNIIIKKTYELSEEDKSMIVNLFESIFTKKRPWEIHLNQFVNNCFGYAWHAILYDNDKIGGVSTYVPAYFNIYGEIRLFANCIDCMIDKPYRDFFAYNDLIRSSYKQLKDVGVDFVYCYPNDNAYPITIKAKLTKDIGKMYTYCLPYRIGGIKPSLKFLNLFSMIFAQSWSFFSGLLASNKVYEFPIHKDIHSYNESRYNRGDANYGQVDFGDGYLYYKIKKHEGVKTAFIIDIDKKSPKNFNRAVRYLLKNHPKDFDLILYPGYLPFKNTGMIKLPRKFEPKKFHFTGKQLANKEELPEEIWKIENWDTNLSNYDLI